MKHPLTRLLAVALSAILLCSTLPLQAAADAPDISHFFTDEAFRASIRLQLGVAPRAPITAAQASTVTHLYVPNRGIESLAGIEHLTNLLVLDVSGNGLTNIDFSTNPTLIRFDVSGNPLTSLNVRQNLNLTQINAAATELTTLDLTQNARLSVLFLPGNPQLIALNLRQNQNLTELNVALCGLTSLDISQNQNLISLIASNNQLQSIALGNLSYLQVLDVSDNQISALNLADLQDLAVLLVENNRLAALNVSQNLGLMSISANGNQIRNLNISNQIVLSDLRVSNNAFATLNVTGNPLLQHLEVANNRLTSLNLTQNEDLVALDVSGNRLTTLDLSHNTKLYSLHVAANQFTALNLAGLNRLRELDVSHNKLPSRQAITGLVESALHSFVYHPQAPYGEDITTAFTDPNLLAALRSALDLGENGAILQAQVNLVTELDLDDHGIYSLVGMEHFVNLQTLSVANNSLTQLNLSILPQLKELDVSGNPLTSLNVTSNPALEHLWAQDNLLEQLDLQQNPALRTLNVASNRLATLWLAENPALQSLNASHNLLQNLDLTHNATVRTLDVRYNFMPDESALLLAPGAFFSTKRFDPQNTLDMDVTDRFADPEFLAAIREALGKEPAAPVNANELRTITALDIAGKGVKSLSGLNFLTNLVTLDCTNNKITGMDISNNIHLRSLDARLNWIENPAAVFGLRESITTQFHFAPQKFSGTNITDAFADPAFLAAVREIMHKDADGPIGSIDAATQESLDLHGRGIQSIAGIEHFSSLQTLILDNNPLQSVELSRNSSLKNLSVAGLCVEALNFSANTALETLNVSRNHLMTLQLLANRQLKNLNATRNFFDNQTAIRLQNAASIAVQFNPQNNSNRTPPTCTTAGFGTWTCSNNPTHTHDAGESQALGHDWVSVATRPTFTQGGRVDHTCSRCGEHFVSDEQPPITLEYQAKLELQYNQATSVFSDIARRAPGLVWASSNQKVLTVDQNGLVTYARVGQGATIVTAKSTDGVERLRVEVKVNIAWWQWLIIIFLFGWIWY